jgi:hypothetical protein
MGVGGQHRTPIRPLRPETGALPESAQGLLNDVGKDRMIDRCWVL